MQCQSKYLILSSDPDIYSPASAAYSSVWYLMRSVRLCSFCVYNSDRYRCLPGCHLLVPAFVQNAAGSGCGSGPWGSGTSRGPARTLHHAALVDSRAHHCPPPERKQFIKFSVYFGSLIYIDSFLKKKKKELSKCEDIVLNLLLVTPYSHFLSTRKVVSYLITDLRWRVTIKTKHTGENIIQMLVIVVLTLVSSKCSMSAVL